MNKAAVAPSKVSGHTILAFDFGTRWIGVSHFLGKPYQEDDLIEKISGFLKERRAAA